MSPPSPVSSDRWIVAILFCAIVLRLGSPGSLGVDHFDEGVYAAAGEALFADATQPAIDHGIIPYGPPLVTVAIAFADFLLGGASDFAAVLPGIVCGTLAVHLAYRLSKTAFGPGPALATAALVATSGMAIAFSRSALTEALFASVWLFAMLAGTRFLKSPGLKGSIVLGIAVGLAQLTKYNGAMTGLIVALTALSDFLIVPRETPRDFGLLRRRIIWGIVAIAIAAVIYAPWVRFVENHGGYRSLMRHHGGYVDGPDRWIPNLRLQLAQSWVFQAQPIAMVVCGFALFVVHRTTERPAGTAGLARILAVAAIPNGAFLGALISIRGAWAKGDVAARLIVVWLLTMIAVTPLYHPYARLWLPGHLASLALAANFIFDAQRSGVTKPRSMGIAPVGLVVSIMAFVGLMFWTADLRIIAGLRHLPSVWSDRANLRSDIAAQIDHIRQATAQGRPVHLLLNPAGRRALALQLGSKPVGPGRLVVVENLSGWNARSGPVIVDLSLVDPSELSSLLEVSRETPGLMAQSEPLKNSRRGLITILDLAPGIALGEKLPVTGIIRIDR